MKTKKFNTSQLTILGLMSGILFLMAYTPLGYLNVGPLAVTFNVIPVAICAVVLGPTGGAVAGAVFGLTSYMQAMGNRWRKCSRICSFSDQPGTDCCSVLCTAYSGWNLPRIYLQSRTQKSEYLCILRSYRILFRFSEHAVLYERTCYDVWKYRTDPESYGWKKYHRRMLRDGWIQCNQ